MGELIAADPSEFSLMLKSDPRNSLVLLKYLKYYSELLFCWGYKELAVQACKLITNACKLLHEYHKEAIDANQDSYNNSDQAFLGTNYHFHWDLRVNKRHWLLSDFLLYSELSLNYIHEVELREVKEKEVQ